MKTEIIKVKGMSCSHCQLAVQDAVRKLPGIKKVKARRRSAEATVSYDETMVDIEQVKAAINDIGYEAS